MHDEPFRLFRHTRTGIPPEVDDWLGCRVDQASGLTPSPNVEEVAEEILDDLRRHPKSRARINAEIYIIVAWHSQHRLPLSPHVLKALARVLELIKDDGTPVVTEAVLERFGYPRVRDLDTFLTASRIDGEADARGEVLPVKELQRRVRNEQGLEPDPEPEDPGRDKPSRDTLSRYRKMPEYGRRREAVKAFASIQATVYGNWNPRKT